MNTSSLKPLYHALLENMGNQGNWPAESPEEIIAGAILVQNTRWENVELSIENIREHLHGDFQKMLTLDETLLQDLIRPSGFYKNKSKSLFTVFSWLGQHDYDYTLIQEQYGTGLRKELLALFGIGQETADVLLLYVFHQPIFIADKYAQKLLSSVTGQTFQDYTSLAQVVDMQDFTPEEAQQFHILILEFGKIYFGRQSRFENSFLFEMEF